MHQEDKGEENLSCGVEGHQKVFKTRFSLRYILMGKVGFKIDLEAFSRRSCMNNDATSSQKCVVNSASTNSQNEEGGR